MYLEGRHSPSSTFLSFKFYFFWPSVIQYSDKSAVSWKISSHNTTRSKCLYDPNLSLWKDILKHDFQKTCHLQFGSWVKENVMSWNNKVSRDSKWFEQNHLVHFDASRRIKDDVSLEVTYASLTVFLKQGSNFYYPACYELFLSSFSG